MELLLGFMILVTVVFIVLTAEFLSPRDDPRYLRRMNYYRNLDTEREENSEDEDEEKKGGLSNLLEKVKKG